MAVSVMNNTESLLANHAEPRCAKCGKLTALKVLMPSFKPGYEERLFECLACGHAETLFIKL